MATLVANNLAELLLKRIELSGQKTALLRKKSGVWSPTSWSEVGRRVFELAVALQKSGIKRGDSVALISQTRPAFFYCDLAIQSLGARTVPIYSAVTADDVFFILNDCEAKFIFVEDPIQFRKVESVRAQLKHPVELVSLEKTQDPLIKSIYEFVAEHMPAAASDVSEARDKWINLVKSIAPSEVASIVYTSGTQGVPKGVELTHQNFMVVLDGLITTLDLTERDVTLFFLPAAHIMGRVEQMVSISAGLTNAYAENLSTLMDNMAEIKPTMIVSVPRVYEKMFSAIQTRFSSESVVAREGFKMALNTGIEYSRVLQSGRRPDAFLKLRYAAADALFFSKIREKLGSKLRFALSGGASLSKELAEFFHAFGVLILEGYGLTETTGPVCVNRPHSFRFGTVGKPIPGCEVRLDPVDSEIIVTGPVVSRGYHHPQSDPESSYKDGAFYSGDIGEISPDGFLRIVDRKRDIMVTSGGKNIAPQKIENLFKSDPLFSNVIVVAEKRHFVSALVTLHKSEARRIAQALNLGAGDEELGGEGLVKFLENEKFHKEVEVRIGKLNEKLAHYEQVQKFRILPREFSIEAGELTPSLKVRRKFCTDKYASIIESLYGSKP